jgi:hypothetical protein
LPLARNICNAVTELESNKVAGIFSAQVSQEFFQTVQISSQQYFEMESGMASLQNIPSLSEYTPEFDHRSSAAMNANSNSTAEIVYKVASSTSAAWFARLVIAQG